MIIAYNLQPLYRAPEEENLRVHLHFSPDFDLAVCHTRRGTERGYGNIPQGKEKEQSAKEPRAYKP
jgi:hypothetical protein